MPLDAPQARLMADIATLAARVMIATYYIAAGFGLLPVPGTLSAHGVADLPILLAFSDTAFQVVAAAFILIGFQTRLAAALLALYVFWSSFIFNFQPGIPEAMAAFMKDFVVVGGLIIIMAQGEGRFGLDAWYARRSRSRGDADLPEAAPAQTPALPQAQPVGFAPPGLRVSAILRAPGPGIPRRGTSAV
ncbi:MAG: DoxX family protein [Rhodobacteraceae bacterium]|nr:DoxX family protein [Paracoccaceae bacterium]